MTIKILQALVLIGVLAACTKATPTTKLEAAQQALAESDFILAAKEATLGLSLKPQQKVLLWRLQWALLEAEARSGDFEAVSAHLEKLASVTDSKIKASHYLSSADQLRGADQAADAVKLLDQGLKRFPDDKDILKAIEQSKTSKSLREELEALRSLGYLD